VSWSSWTTASTNWSRARTAKPSASRTTPNLPRAGRYDVEKLYVERESMAARGLTEDDLLVDVEVLSSAERPT